MNPPTLRTRACGAFCGAFCGASRGASRGAIGLAAVLLLSAAPLAQAQTGPVAGLLACQKLAEATARLACYDREVAQLAATPTPATPSAMAPAAAAAALPTTPRAAEERFGLPAKAGNAEPTSIVSALPEGFSGWRAGERIRLANGQVWRIADDSSAFVSPKSPRVVVRQGALGAFYLDFDGDNRSPRVRRVE